MPLFLGFDWRIDNDDINNIRYSYDEDYPNELLYYNFPNPITKLYLPIYITFVDELGHPQHNYVEVHYQGIRNLYELFGSIYSFSSFSMRSVRIIDPIRDR